MTAIPPVFPSKWESKDFKVGGYNIYKAQKALDNLFSCTPD